MICLCVLFPVCCGMESLFVEPSCYGVTDTIVDVISNGLKVEHYCIGACMQVVIMSFDHISFNVMFYIYFLIISHMLNDCVMGG